VTEAEHAAVAKFWARQERDSRVHWFKRAGFNEAYSAPTWESLARLLPEMAEAIGTCILGSLRLRP
jgi:hypothetical protein